MNIQIRIINKIRELKSGLSSPSEYDKSFIFPYSSDVFEKRIEIWNNLQKGILLEDCKQLIPWSTPFKRLICFKGIRHDLSDRIYWTFGEHIILDGYICQLKAMKWRFSPWKSQFSEISVNIGTDLEGSMKFIDLKEKFTDLLGEPKKVELEKMGTLDLGLIEWINGKVKISLVGIERFECRYSLEIGLTDNKKDV